VTSVPRLRSLWAAPAALLLALTIALPAGATNPAGRTATAASGGARPDVPRSPNGAYVVVLRDQPAAPWAHARHTRLNRADPEVKDYVARLDGRRRQVLAGTHGITVHQTYDYASVGFTAAMSHREAQGLAADPDVLFVAPDLPRQGADYDTPTYLGLTQHGGLWDRLGGNRKAGDGVIIGDIDSGITPESPAFAALPPSPTDAKVRARWHGVCVAGTTGPAVHCNNKLIGARVYGPGSVDAVPDEFYGSPRDYDGHGDHTASTAAGDYGVPMTVDGRDFGKFSGVAPAARIAMYKALWHKANNTTEGDTGDLTKAIDDAVADGVDVITYSISSDNTSVEDDPIAYAFYNAAKAGIFVSTAASNDGPGASTVKNNYPWVTTVGASTFDIARRATVTLGDGSSYDGVGLGAAVPSSPLVLSTDAGLAGADATKVRQCWSKDWDPDHPEGFLDPAKVAGTIVVCDRGNNDRVDKSKAVQAAGGVGMLLVNPTPNTLNADLHAVPTIHLDEVSGAAVKTYVASTSDPTASFSAGRNEIVDAPAVASFSSRGPALAADGQLLKPDVIAPGVDVLAAVAPVSHHGRAFDFESGTSMATPHVAGAAALLLQQHPDWSPMAIKSALTTTARITTRAGKPIPNDDGSRATPFDMGGGEIDPDRAADAAVVYDSTSTDWARFLCGLGSTPPDRPCTGSIAADELNAASIAVPALAGTATISRTLTNVSSRTWSGRVSVDAPAGTQVTISPSRLVIRPHHKATFRVRVTRTTAAFGSHVFGSFTWQAPGSTPVRSPLVVKPVTLAAPTSLTLSGSAGSARLTVRPGYSGSLDVSQSGPVPAIENSAHLSDPTGASFPVDDPVTSAHTARFTVATPAGTTYARFATFTSDLAPGTDVDLYVYEGGTDKLVASSSQSGSDEWVWVSDPAVRSYDVYVDLFAGPAQDVRQPSWVLGAATPLLTLSPTHARVRAGVPASLRLRWKGLAPSSRYLARITYGSGNPGAGTLVRITP